MTLKEIEDKITFSAHRRGRYVEHRATLSLCSSVFSTDNVLENLSAIEREALFGRAREQLLRDIYADRRRESYEALERIWRADHLDYKELTEAKEALLSALHRQIPDYI